MATDTLILFFYAFQNFDVYIYIYILPFILFREAGGKKQQQRQKEEKKNEIKGAVIGLCILSFVTGYDPLPLLDIITFTLPI